ncbi:hypothetical protein [Sinobaca sp. H24]|nr:hypothetical protein [Sinobaca sp. H24]
MNWKDYREGKEAIGVVVFGILLIVTVFSILHFVFGIPFFP